MDNKIFKNLFLYPFAYLQFRIKQALLVIISMIDDQRMKSIFPGYIYINREFRKSELLFTQSYEVYISTISSNRHAASLSQAVFLYAWCMVSKPKKILDLGSGYSTYVFGLYKNVHKKIQIDSVDDSSSWMRKTKKFLKSNKSCIPHFYLWSEFVKMSKKNYDFIFYDLGTMETRAQNISMLLKFMGPSTIVCLDDLHFPVYENVVHNFCINNNLQYYSTRKYTKDKFGRFSYLVMRKR